MCSIMHSSIVPAQEVQADVAVIGGGFAGWTAARRSQQLGARVVLLEKGPSKPGWGNSTSTGGAIHALYHSPKEQPEKIYEIAMKETAGASRPDLVRVWAETVGRVVDWLISESVELKSVVPIPKLMPMLTYAFVPFRPHASGDENFRDKGPEVALKQLNKNFEDNGGQVFVSTAARHLMLDAQGRISGVLALHNDGYIGIRASSVVLADGGFPGNPEMMNRYVGPYADEVFIRGMRLPDGRSPHTGDGIRMALAVNAKAVNMSQIRAHILSLDVFQKPLLSPYPIMNKLLSAGILVNRQGERITDEGLNGYAAANVIVHTDDPRGTFIIFDESMWRGAGADATPVRSLLPGPERAVTEIHKIATHLRGAYAPNPDLVKLGGTLYSDEDLSTLGLKAGIYPRALEATVREYNQSLENGTTNALPIPRTGKSVKPNPIIKPPFHAVPVVPGITFTMGGLLIDKNANVLDVDERPIPGLYAAGDIVGGLMGGRKGGYLGGLAQALVFGLLAGEDAIKQAKGSRN
jgi:fumarate reductase flavoprotein subunit